MRIAEGVREKGRETMDRATHLVQRYLGRLFAAITLSVALLGGCRSDDGQIAHTFAALTGPGIVGSRTAVGWGTANLSVEGTLDWAHWGLTNETSFRHQRGLTQRSSNFPRVGTAPTLQLDCCADNLSWTAGTPAASATRVIGRVYVDTPHVSGDGFRIT